MGEPRKITIQILDLPGASGGCICSDLSTTPLYVVMLRTQIEALQAALNDAFPGSVRLEYSNLRQDATARDSAPGQLLVTKRYPTPLVVIDGKVRFAGSILVDKIVDEARRALDTQQEKGMNNE